MEGEGGYRGLKEKRTKLMTMQMRVGSLSIGKEGVPKQRFAVFELRQVV